MCLRACILVCVVVCEVVCVVVVVVVLSFGVATCVCACLHTCLNLLSFGCVCDKLLECVGCAWLRLLWFAFVCKYVFLC